MVEWTKVDTQSIEVKIAGVQEAQQGQSNGIMAIGAFLLLLLLYFIFRRK